MALDKTNINDGRLRIGQAIRSAREEQNLTCEELGARIGVTRQTISKIENGRYSVGIDTILQIADALGKVWVLEPTLITKSCIETWAMYRLTQSVKAMRKNQEDEQK